MAPRLDDYVKAAQGFLAKSDGRDKLLATLQYAAMVAAAGEAGRALKVQKNLGAARKPFRVLKARAPRRAGRAGRALPRCRAAALSQPGARAAQPAEALLPLLASPLAPLTPLALAAKVRWRRPRGAARGRRGISPRPSQTDPNPFSRTRPWRRAQLKALSMAAFFGFDHVVWAGGAGLVEDKTLLEKAQKLSFYGWLLGSLCQLAADAAELRKLLAARDKARAAAGDAPGAAAAADAAAAPALHQRAIAATGTAAQAALAAALLGLLPLKPRTIGLIGVTTSAIACYQLMPPLPKAEPPKAKDA